MNELNEWAWPDFVSYIDFFLVARRCFSCWRLYYPSDGYITQSQVESAFCPEVLAVCWSELYVNVLARRSSVQYTPEHTVSMLITFVPISAVRFLLSVCRDKTLLRVWMSTSPPPYFHSQLCVFVHWSTLSLLCCSFVCSDVQLGQTTASMIISRDILKAVLRCAVCFVERSFVAHLPDEPIQPAQAHVDRQRRGINLS